MPMNREPDFPFNPFAELRRLIADDPRRETFELLIRVIEFQMTLIDDLEHKVEKLELPREL
jgi:hypothetical protein